jgi:tRNA pseudouridine55 synthase
MNGVIIVDKPGGWTSHDVVNRMRRILGQRSVGHLGTLDPLATGVLPLVVGSFTRLAQFYNASEKTYEGVIRFGFATTTYDADGDVLGEVRPAAPAIEQVRQIAGEFVGVIEQVPPPFSAKKIHGVPAYKLARKRKEVKLQPVKVEIKEFAITGVEDDRADFCARVASGTYMRSVAHELGQKLGCGAHLASLRRTAVAEFVIDQAHAIEEIEGAIAPDAGASVGCHSERKHVHGAESGARRGMQAVLASTESERLQTSEKQTRLCDFFVHPRQLLPQFPSVTADEATVARIRNGRTVNLPELSRSRHVKVFANQTELLAIATRVAGTLFHPKIVFVGGE